MPYYNTTDLTGKELNNRRIKSKGQKLLVFNTILKMEYDDKIENESFTPCEVWCYIGQLTCPLTSIRRAITNLTKDGHLNKTKQKRKGIYGADNYCWEISKQKK